MGSEKPKLTNAVNMPDPHNPGMRIIGWRVTEDEAGLSDALFFLDEVRAAYEGTNELRDRFAAAALQGIISAQIEFAKLGGLLNPDDASRHAASRSYEIAAAMIAERAKSQSGENHG